MTEFTTYKGDLILVRGLSGSGKTTVAELIVPKAEVCSADDFFVNSKTGAYEFDGSKLKDAHAYCQRKCRLRMAAGAPVVVVANTFTREWEMQAYMELAETFRYRLHTVVVENRHGSKNIHEVPDEVVEAQKDRFEIKL